MREMFPPSVVPFDGTPLLRLVAESYKNFDTAIFGRALLDFFERAAVIAVAAAFVLLVHPSGINAVGGVVVMLGVCWYAQRQQAYVNELSHDCSSGCGGARRKTQLDWSIRRDRLANRLRRAIPKPRSC